MIDRDDLECRIAREESRHQASVMATRRMIRKVNQQESKGQS
ncbi:hypothetical protein [Pectobacterium betavasculorum]|nr:hypothetical protein [Pectobacterium betavasculorum]